ncbi:hypothetical protein L484_013130 [Morus notabilis]|uniref:CRAL/TRIO N-terminal domain-containing protein n=1 Tax=Morus notabilis TaxID=981085 RepID=W9S0I3_9ROSA|nr:hypothetical protein L484_013130 [Morus notabilis]
MDQDDINHVNTNDRDRDSNDNGINDHETNNRSSIVVVGSDFNEIEKSKVAILKALLQREDPSSSQEVDDYELRRFLRARDMDIEKASNMFLKYRSWKKSFMPNGSISASEIPQQISHDKLFMQGFDKQGRPIVVVFGARHKPGKVDDFRRILHLSNYF